MMRKTILCATVALVAILALIPGIALAASSFTVGPATVTIPVTSDGTGTTSVYITSSFDGELVVGIESLPLEVEPEKITVTKTDQNRKVDLSFRGDDSFEMKPYSGKLTFLAYTGSNVAYGVKIKANVEAQQQGQQMDETSKTSFTAWIKGNAIIVIVVLVALIALFGGLLIGRRQRA
jgi:hypothetical protein